MLLFLHWIILKLDSGCYCYYSGLNILILSTQFHIGTAFAFMNASFWLITADTFYRYWDDASLYTPESNIAKYAMPVASITISLLGFGVRSILGRRYVHKMTLLPGWKTVKLECYGMIKTTQRTINLDRINLRRKISRDDTWYFHVKGIRFYFNMDRKGRITNSTLLERALTGKSLLNW
eukprot:TRINITY_DN1952_c1_g1_i1.p1 TRINITY_DN1952_c1_g1~~TRINITY_DN1952_c1_g1_i1.p1  ORF type:complete len:179 (-),score=13.84 TRINITY_DN1952_c1_g1_i1:65-601(-)